MVISKTEVSPENIYFYTNGDVRGYDTNSTSKSSYVAPPQCKDTRLLLSNGTPPQCKDTRLLLSSGTNNNIYRATAEEGEVSRRDGIKDMLSNNELTRVGSKCSNISGSASTRLVTKDGIVDIKYKNVPGISKHYLTDIFHTLIDAKWRYIIILFTLSFIVSWLCFGTLWFGIVKADNTRSHRHCIDNVDDWVSAFLFSIEIQTTIGFGGRAVTSNCPEGVLLLVVQTILGMFINCAMLGLLFAKLSRPKNRGKATLFSDKAIITIRDGKYCLIFRYVDFRPRRLVDSNIRLVMVRQKLTKEGEFVPLDMADMKITIDFKQNEYQLRLFPLFPLTIIHEIDEFSPLYKFSRLQLEEHADFEIIPILEGTVPTTGSTTQALSSYKPNEILWGHRFEPFCKGQHINHAIHRIDLSTLHNTIKEERDVPECSAKDWYKDHDDCSSLGSHGYESGTRSHYSSFDQLKRSQLVCNDEDDVRIDIGSKEMQDMQLQLQQMKETDA